jgi:ferredoxin-NADP reductase
MFTVKHPSPASAFKRQLDKLKTGDVILASRLAGGFTLPNDTSKKLAWLAGGIGITPFRSMTQYLVDSKQSRDAVLLYSANTEAELSFKKVFAQAEANGLKSHYITKGRLDQLKIKNLVPNYMDREFYISGPYGFVSASEEALLRLGVKPSAIVTDYFPGYGS